MSDPEEMPSGEAPQSVFNVIGHIPYRPRDFRSGAGHPYRKHMLRTVEMSVRYPPRWTQGMAVVFACRRPHRRNGR